MSEDFLTPMPRVVAHRGDSANWPENTLEAFISGVMMGIDVIETDVHLSKDGHVVIWHDPTLERNTDGIGTLESHTLAELRQYDAGYTFTKDGGRTFPFRGRGIRICTLDEALEACPGQRFNIDLKSREPEIVDRYIEVIRRHDAGKRVCTASFHDSNMRMLRAKAPDLLTSVSTKEVLSLVLRQKTHTLPARFARKIIFQVPEAYYGVRIITDGFIRAMHARDAVVMVWTINDEKDMERLFRMGVDTIMTDDPALLIRCRDRLGIH